MRWLSFRRKLLIIGVAPVMILGILIGVLLYGQANEIVSNAQKKVVADTINRIDINLNAKVRAINGYIRLAVDTLPTAQAMESGAGRRVMVLFRDRMTEVTDGLFSITVFLDDRVVYADSNQAGMASALGQLREMEALAAASPGRALWSGLEDSLYALALPEGQRVVRVYQHVPAGEDHGGGLLVAELTPDAFSGLVLAAQNTLAYQHTYIQDGDGTVVCSGQSVRAEWAEAIGENLAQGRRKFVFDWNGAPQYCCGQYNGLTGWTTLSVIAVDKLFPQAETLLRSICGMVSVTVALMLLFILLLYRSITMPLNALSRAMKAAQDQNFTLRLPPGRADEIGYLSTAFNDMMDRMDQLINEVYQRKLAQQSAEMEALQAQINPHFLYNTLDSINWMLIERGDMDISDIVVSLGSLMHYTMETERATVSLRLEYDYVRDYLSIQKCRLTDRLQYSLHLDPALEAFVLPKLVLQPLVENAIRHGVEPLKRGGHIAIDARLSPAGAAVLSVRDTGRGIPAARCWAPLSSAWPTPWPSISSPLAALPSFPTNWSLPCPIF